MPSPAPALRDEESAGRGTLLRSAQERLSPTAKGGRAFTLRGVATRHGRLSGAKNRRIRSRLQIPGFFAPLAQNDSVLWLRLDWAALQGSGKEVTRRGRAATKTPIPNSKFRIPNSGPRKAFAGGEESDRY
jgi:hypothetical protein